MDLYGTELEAALLRRLSEQAADFEQLLRQLEREYSYLATTEAQLKWLRRFPAGKVGGQGDPIVCQLPSGTTVAVPQLLGPLHRLELDSRMLGTSNGHRRRRRDHQRRGNTPVMIALADAGLSTRVLAREMGVSKSAPWAWLNGRHPAPRELAVAIERLTGDPTVARTIVELIPQPLHKVK